jgi:hypothetical protein
MKKTVAAFLVLTAVCYSVMSRAQPQPQAAPAAATGNTALLDERFTTCMDNKDCSIQARLQIIQEEDDQMNDHFQRIHQICADANFQDCIDGQKKDVQAWYAAQNNMQKIMRSMESQTLSEKEPSAGESASADDGKGKSFWQKIWPFSDDK